MLSCPWIQRITCILYIKYTIAVILKPHYRSGSKHPNWISASISKSYTRTRKKWVLCLMTNRETESTILSIKKNINFMRMKFTSIIGTNVLANLLFLLHFNILSSDIHRCFYLHWKWFLQDSDILELNMQKTWVFALFIL